jgi:hypothetical protein
LTRSRRSPSNIFAALGEARLTPPWKIEGWIFAFTTIYGSKVALELHVIGLEEDRMAAGRLLEPKGTVSLSLFGEHTKTKWMDYKYRKMGDDGSHGPGRKRNSGIECALEANGRYNCGMIPNGDSFSTQGVI